MFTAGNIYCSADGLAVSKPDHSVFVYQGYDSTNGTWLFTKQQIYQAQAPLVAFGDGFVMGKSYTSYFYDKAGTLVNSLTVAVYVEGYYTTSSFVYMTGYKTCGSVICLFA